MWSPATVSIDDNLSSSKTGIGSWSSNNERSRWVDYQLSVGEHLCWADLLDDLLVESVLDGLVVDSGVVLGGNQDVVDGNWDDLATLLSVFNNNLRLAIGSEPSDFSRVSLLSHSFGDLVGQVVGVWEQGLSVPFVGGIAEHESLISGSKVLLVLLGFVDSLGDFSGLGFNLDENIAVVAVKTNIL